VPTINKWALTGQIYMYKQILETKYSVQMNEGIDPNDIPGISKSPFNYQHGRVEDLMLVLNNADPKYTNNNGTNQIKFVISKELSDSLLEWGVVIPNTKPFILYETRRHVTIKKDNYKSIVSYECNSREIFKPLNNLIRCVKAQRKLIKFKEPDYFIAENCIKFSKLMGLILADNQELSIKSLKNVHTSKIQSTIESAKFKHFYKLAHPDTTFIIKDN